MAKKQQQKKKQKPIAVPPKVPSMDKAFPKNKK
jgi:hypothetical protein